MVKTSPSGSNGSSPTGNWGVEEPVSSVIFGAVSWGVAKEKVGSSMCSRELKLKVTEITEESFEDHEDFQKRSAWPADPGHRFIISA